MDEIVALPGRIAAPTVADDRRFDEADFQARWSADGVLNIAASPLQNGSRQRLNERKAEHSRRGIVRVRPCTRSNITHVGLQRFRSSRIIPLTFNRGEDADDGVIELHDFPYSGPIPGCVGRRTRGH